MHNSLGGFFACLHSNISFVLVISSLVVIRSKEPQVKLEVYQIPMYNFTILNFSQTPRLASYHYLGKFYLLQERHFWCSAEWCGTAGDWQVEAQIAALWFAMPTLERLKSEANGMTAGPSRWFIYFSNIMFDMGFSGWPDHCCPNAFKEKLPALDSSIALPHARYISKLERSLGGHAEANLCSQFGQSDVV